MPNISSTDICNRALQKLGQKRIQTLDDGTTASDACKVAYDWCRRAELEQNNWNFAIERDSLPADAGTPTGGRQVSVTLPPDFIKLLDPYPEDPQSQFDRDWQIEGRQILTNESAPIDIRYIADVTDCTLFSPLFSEALACRMALEMCEELTQSNEKKRALTEQYDQAIRRAALSNALQKVPAIAPDAEWITRRS